MKTRTAICAVLFATAATFVPVTRAQLTEPLRVGNVHPLTDVFERKLDGPAYSPRARIDVFTGRLGRPAVFLTNTFVGADTEPGEGFFSLTIPSRPSTGTSLRVVAYDAASSNEASYFRSANAIPRELGLFKDGGEFYVSAYPVAELSNLEKESRTVGPMAVAAGKPQSVKLFDSTDGAYELEMDINVPAAGRAGFRLGNAAGDVVDMYFDASLQRFVMDRTKSGLTEFAERSTTHEIENHDRRKTNSMNYVNDFALATWAPVSVKGSHKVKVLYDLTSLEVFIDGGRVAMTNLVFPNDPYDVLEFYSDKGRFPVDRLAITALGL